MQPKYQHLKQRNNMTKTKRKCKIKAKKQQY